MNKHLNKLNLEVSELDTQVRVPPEASYQRAELPAPRLLVALDEADVFMSQFADGVYLVLLMGLLEGYFVPLYNFFLTPENFDQKVKQNP